MPRPKPINYNPPADLLARLSTGKPIVTRGDKLALLRTLGERAGSTVQAGTNRTILAAIEADIRAAGRAQKSDAPANTRAPLKAEQRSEGGSSIPERVLERKISEDITVAIGGSAEHSINLYTHGQFLICFTPDQADQLAAALTELVGDLRQDANARAWSQELVAATAE